MTIEDRETFLAQPHVGVVASLRRDGRPYTVPVWHLWDGIHMWLTGTTSRVWCRQLMHDPRISLCVEHTDAAPGSGTVIGHVEVDGAAEVLEPPAFDIWPVSRALAQKYIGRGNFGRAETVDAFVANMAKEPRLLIRITPEVWRAIDMSVYEGKRADRDHQ